MMNLRQCLLILGPLVGYLLGSIPFGLIIGLARGVDIRKVGSGNIGATNLGRALGMRYFWYAFVLDALKGLLPTLAVSIIAYIAGLPSWVALVTGVATLCGHIFPIYLKFKGGKGVATSFGVVLGVWPIFTLAGVAAGLVFLVVFMAYRYISLASITSSVCFVPFVLVLGLYTAQPWHSLGVLLAAAFLLALLIVVKHRANIRRLLAGTEPKYTRTNTLAANRPG
jgi:acyl phosphate:glycerol-3-phosphate acyltransferase